MPTAWRPAIVGLAMLVIGPDARRPTEAARPSRPSPGPTFAFNGRDLDGFSVFTRFHHADDPEAVFSVEDGMIHVSGAEFGGLSTREEFSDYRLVVEWKWGARTWWPRKWRARNSGVVVHAGGPEGAGFGSWLEGFECQILEGGTGDLILIPGKGHSPTLVAPTRISADGQPYFDPTAAPQPRKAGRLNWWGRDPGWLDILWARGPSDLDHPPGQWNMTELTCHGDTIEVRINGQLANAASGLSSRSGKIQLQSEGAEIFFRKFEVWPLEK